MILKDLRTHESTVNKTNKEGHFYLDILVKISFRVCPIYEALGEHAVSMRAFIETLTRMNQHGKNRAILEHMSTHHHIL